MEFSKWENDWMLRLLLPEWQGYGLSSEVAEGARVLARAWWGDDGGAAIDVPDAEALHAHRYSTRGLFRRSYLIGRALGAVGRTRGATLGESVRFLADEVRYFVRQGHAHRLPGLLRYEFVRWAGFQAGCARGRLPVGAS